MCKILHICIAHFLRVGHHEIAQKLCKNKKKIVVKYAIILQKVHERNYIKASVLF
jgi:hypothetical protein